MPKEPKKLDGLFHDTLKDIYFAEKQILATLPKMAKAAQSEELTAAFQTLDRRRSDANDFGKDRGRWPCATSGAVNL
jgi:hypothetical protein